MNIDKSLKTILFILTLIFALMLVGCDEEEEIVKVGIDIKDSKEEYLESVREYASFVIFSLMSEYEEKSKSRPLTKEESEELLKSAQDIEAISASYFVGEEKYLEIFKLLDKERSALIDEMQKLFSKGEKRADYAFLKKVYLSICGITSNEYIGKTLYGILEYSLTKKYEKEMALYEENNYPYLLEGAERLLEEKRILTEEIGSDKFGGVINLGLIFADLFIISESGIDSFDSFSDEEIIVFIEYIDISNTDIGTKGWELVLSYFAKMNLFSEDSSFFTKVITQAERNSDLEKIASRMGDVVKLISFIKDSLSCADVAAMRTSSKENCVSLMFSKFTEREWDVFESIFSLPINVLEYNMLAAEFYGEEFVRYENECNRVDFENLKESSGNDDFYKNLKGYIAAFCPAFSYGM